VYAFAAQPVEDALDQRRAGERDRRFGDESSERIETGAETGREHQCG
jgi:hypothetical protein